MAMDDKTVSLKEVLAEIDAMPPVKAEGHDFIEKTCLKTRLELLPSAQPGCEDAVSRFEVLRLIDYSSNDLNDSVDNWYFQGKVKELPSVTPKQPGWIPVTERLPRPNEEDGNGFYKAYLVQDGRWMDVARWDGKYWVAWGYSTVLLNVVAWCELPTPYREGGQDG